MDHDVANSASAELYQRALKVMPGGCSRNTILHEPHPLYAVKGEGCYVTDIEGVKRVDFANNVASMIHGHAFPDIVSAVTAQLHKGTGFTLGTEAEIIYAEHMTTRNKAFEKIRFVNSGTEAVMACLKAARAFTGRPKIAKVEGAYHGLYDYAEVSQTANPSNWGTEQNPASVPVAFGTPQSVLDDVIIIPFNNADRAIEILDQHADELACVLVDLMPHRVALHPANKEFIHRIHEWTRKAGALFICDEVITFRGSYGGAQEWYDIRPDLTAMGKMIGGGFPSGALAGDAEVMDVMDPTADKVLFPHAGTFSANPVTMVAGFTAMNLFDRDAVNRLNSLAEFARDQLREVIKLADVPACVTGAGSMFRVHMRPEAPRNYRESFATPEQTRLVKSMLDYLLDHGFIMINTCSGALSTVMTEREIDALSEAMLGGFRLLKKTWKS